MKNSNLPDPLKKREILNAEKPDVELCKRLGEEYITLGRYIESLEMFAKIDWEEGIDRLLDIAMEEGDLFLYKEGLKAKGIEKDGDWIKLAENAVKKGKFFFAKEAFELGDEPDRAKEILDIFKKGDSKVENGS